MPLAAELIDADASGAASVEWVSTAIQSVSLADAELSAAVDAMRAADPPDDDDTPAETRPPWLLLLIGAAMVATELME